MIRSCFLLLIILAFQTGASAQEKLYSLEQNATVRKKAAVNLSDSRLNYSDTVFVTLPFLDDFSVISVWPSSQKWADNYAYVNSDFARYAPTIGVATLDAIDENGLLYASAGPYQFEADVLTSQPIRLDSIFTPVARPIQKDDSVYLSFYYQPQGKGSMPAKKDSLVLEFHSPVEFDTIISSGNTVILPKWHYVWSTAGGMQVDTFAYVEGSYFKQVLIPINDSSLYFKKGFRFRFRNYASLANNYVPDWQSNGDQWNIDMVYLNVGRSHSDSFFTDVAFADRAPSLLARYEAMPYSQYGENYVNEMKDSLDILIANLDYTAHNISYKYHVQKDSQLPFKTYDGGSYSSFPFSTNGYCDYQPFARPIVNLFYSPFENQESIVFHSTHFLSNDPAMVIKTNDTIRYTQVFSNYYAYDDGTAEAGIGLNGSSGSYAVRFELNSADTLHAMQIFFNQVRSASSDNYIDLTVWNDALGKPGNIIKQIPQVNPIYSDSLNTFQTYWFEEPLSINAVSFPGLIFYIGWQQTSIDNLNVGLDRYNDSHQYRFYNVSGTWQSSDDQHAGSLLFRPVIGSKHPVSLHENKSRESLSIFPNPTFNGHFRIDLPDEISLTEQGSLLISIINLQGSKVWESIYSSDFNVDHLAKGFYLIRMENTHTGKSYTGKLIIR